MSAALQVLVSLSDLRKYWDRLLLLREAAEPLGGIAVLTQTLPAGLDYARLRSPALSLVPLARQERRRPIYQALLWAEARRREQAGPVHLLHDLQCHMLPLFAYERLARPRERVLLSSTFTATYEWLNNLRRQVPQHSLHLSRVLWQNHLDQLAMARLADAFTVFGEGHRAPYARCYRVPLARVHSLPSCIDPEFFRPVAPDPAALGFDTARHPVLLYTGEIIPFKGSFVLLRAFARVLRRHPAARLVLVGPLPPPEAPHLQAELRRLALGEAVRLAGPCARERLPGMLAACAGFVFPSLNEGSPRSVMEAMACARPVIASRLPGIETLDPAGQALELVEPGDEVALAEAVERLLDSPRQAAARGEQGRARFLAHHTPAQAAPALVALYRDLVSQGPQAPSGWTR